MRRNREINWGLYVVLDTSLVGQRNPLDLAQAVLAAGAAVLQVRAKQWSIRQQVTLIKALLLVTQAFCVPLIVNDHIDVALATGADGVHLGADDMPVRLARQIFPDGILGYSPEDTEDARRAAGEGADYLGCGPFAATSTKPDAGQAIGAEGITRMVQAVTIPVIAIGGINRSNMLEAIRAGAVGVAVASAVIASLDPAESVHELCAILSEGKT